MSSLQLQGDQYETPEGTWKSKLLYRIVQAVNSFPRIGNSFPRIRQMNQFEGTIYNIREIGLFKLRERIAIRENGLSYSRNRITNPWERLTNP